MQLIEYKREIFFFKNYAENEARGLAPELFLFLKKVFCKIKTSGRHLSFNIIGRSRQIKTKQLIQRYAQFFIFKIKANLITFQTVDQEIC